MTSNAKKIFYNLFFGVGSQLILAAVGIVIPRLFITSFGSEVNGFLSSVNQVFSYVVLLEAGVGTATLQALYKPVAENDTDKMNGILSATDRFYRRTGWCYLGCVLLLAVIYPIAIKSSIPVWQQVAVILIIGGSGSISYFFHAKFRMLLYADGKTYVFTNAHTLVQLGTSITKVVMILLGMNIVFVQLGHMLLMAALALYICRYTRKNYPWIDLRVPPDNQAISEKNSVLIHEISQMIFNHTDVIILTIFTNLKVVSVYVVYNMVVDIISTLINNVHNSFSFRLGQIFNTDKNRYRKTYDVYETGYMTLSMMLYCITYIFLIPFMRLYTDGVSDVNYLDPLLPVMFVSIKLLVSGRALAGATISYAGRFKDTRVRAIIEMVINLVVSIVCVNIFGIYGVLLGTIAALLYRANDMVLYTSKVILAQSPIRTYAKWIVNIVIFIGVVLFSIFFAPINASDYLSLVLYAIVYSIGVFLVFTLTNSLVFQKNAQTICSYLIRHFIRKQK